HRLPSSLEQVQQRFPWPFLSIGSHRHQPVHRALPNRHEMHLLILSEFVQPACDLAHTTSIFREITVARSSCQRHHGPVLHHTAAQRSSPLFVSVRTPVELLWSAWISRSSCIVLSQAENNSVPTDFPE